jgi:hypothetical protein
LSSEDSIDFLGGGGALGDPTVSREKAAWTLPISGAKVRRKWWSVISMVLNELSAFMAVADSSSSSAAENKSDEKADAVEGVAGVESAAAKRASARGEPLLFFSSSAAEGEEGAGEEMPNITDTSLVESLSAFTTSSREAVSLPSPATARRW